MKNYLNCRSISARALLALAFFTAGGCLVVKAASFRPEATNTASQRTLTFADRVAYQHAVEQVTGSTGSGRRKIQGPNHR
jgi:hypothetical protein